MNKKLISLLLAAAMLVTLLAACGSKNETPAANNAPAGESGSSTAAPQ